MTLSMGDCMRGSGKVSRGEFGSEAECQSDRPVSEDDLDLDSQQSASSFAAALRSPKFQDDFFLCFAPPALPPNLAPPDACNNACASAARKVRYFIGAATLITGLCSVGLATIAVGPGALVATDSINIKECACKACCASGRDQQSCLNSNLRPHAFDQNCGGPILPF
jgi:hypothetical protein